MALTLAKAAFNDVLGVTAIGPLRRVKLLIQNQNQMLKTGRLSEPYEGIPDCFVRTMRNEGFFSLWRGKSALVVKVFVTPVIVLSHRSQDWHLDTITKREFSSQRDTNQIVIGSGLLGAWQHIAQLTLKRAFFGTPWTMHTHAWLLISRPPQNVALIILPLILLDALSPWTLPSPVWSAEIAGLLKGVVRGSSMV